MHFISLLLNGHVLLAVASATAIIDTTLQQAFATGKPENTENVIISFNQSTHIVIEEINKITFANIHEKRTALTVAQQQLANNVQRPLQEFLRNKQIAYESFWINNKMYVPNASVDLVNAISTFPGVTSIRQEMVIMLNPVNVGEPEVLANKSTLDWGIQKIRADQVWKSHKGKGVVVAGIDTGVRHTHEALSGRWREHHGWFDAVSGKRVPYDDNGHGIHTMGTMVGTHGIGVAPEATWIACRGCDGMGRCTDSYLTRCGQWVQCPTDWEGKNKNCSMAPDIVSNSWGRTKIPDRDFYDRIISSWQASGIIPVFAIGNEGPFCGTTGTPGDRPNVISVGSIDENNVISSFSSLGPSGEGTMQPLIAAPGGKIRSAWNTNDTAYNTISGTSMSCPHVSGVIALMRSKVHHISFEKVFDAIISTTNKKLNDSTAPSFCGHLVSSRYPNNIFGYGLIDALNAVNAIK